MAHWQNKANEFRKKVEALDSVRLEAVEEVASLKQQRDILEGKLTEVKGANCKLIAENNKQAEAIK